MNPSRNCSCLTIQVYSSLYVTNFVVMSHYWSNSKQLDAVEVKAWWSFVQYKRYLELRGWNVRWLWHQLCQVTFSPSVLPPSSPHTSPSDHSAGCRNFPHRFLVQAALRGIIWAKRLLNFFQWILDCLTNTSHLCKFVHIIKTLVFPNLF